MNTAPKEVLQSQARSRGQAAYASWSSALGGAATSSASVPAASGEAASTGGTPGIFAPGGTIVQVQLDPAATERLLGGGAASERPAGVPLPPRGAGATRGAASTGRASAADGEGAARSGEAEERPEDPAAVRIAEARRAGQAAATRLVADGRRRPARKEFFVVIRNRAGERGLLVGAWAAIRHRVLVDGFIPSEAIFQGFYTRAEAQAYWDSVFPGERLLVIN